MERFALIARIQYLLRQSFPLSVALHQVSSCPITLPNGTQRRVARRTLEDWWYDYQHGGFAALTPKGRADKGQPRLLTAEQQKSVLAQAQAHLAVPVKVLYCRWREQDPLLPSINTVYRFLREHHLHTKGRRQQLAQPVGGATKSFEAPFVNDLWMVDFSPGPFLSASAGVKAVPTALCVIIDDHSRLIPYGAYYLRADTQAFHQTLKEALRRRGVPTKLYTDQGRPFTCDHTRIVCANLGIRLLHAKPYHAWSKGKSERVLFTIQQDFEAGLRLPGQAAGTLEELNARFSLWLQSVYLQKKREKEAILHSVRTEKATRQKMIAELKEASRRMLEIIRESTRTDEYEGKGFTQLKGKLVWPAEGRIAIPYGSHKDPQFDTPVFRNGIHIQTGSSDDARAVYSGKVIFAEWFKGFSQLIIINHGGGYHTLYGNLSEIFSKVGDIIKENQLIGKVCRNIGRPQCSGYIL